MLVRFFWIILITVILFLVVYKTDFGLAVAGFVPQSFWLDWHKLFCSNSAERCYDAEALFFVLLFGVMSVFCVGLISYLMRRVRERTGRPL